MKPVTYAFRGGVLCADRGGDAAGQRLAGSGMLPFMTPIFLQVGMGFTPFHAGLMMIPMVLGNRGMKRIVVQIVNRFGYRKVLIALPALVFRHVPADVSKNAMLSRRPGRH